MINDDEALRYGAALLVVFLGIMVIAVLTYFLPIHDGWKSTDVIALIGTMTTFLGSIVGAFLGVQAGAAGKQKAQDLLNSALAALPTVDAQKVLGINQNNAQPSNTRTPEPPSPA